ncbi:cytochrome c [Thalassotalea sp. G2M2-11]|uniref:c-type cytochrome n=1 Tax=Thalassotalea sp. G2M2-11 TaxID=2787627 RepID=UPI0019D0B87C|nr:cytochrome c [Thalassotalea sp. G2M2-11]
MMKILITYFLVLLLSLIASTSVYAGNAKTGKKYYQENCAQCHGLNGKPTLPRAANFSKKEGLRVSDSALVQRIKHGGKTCPAYSGLLRDAEIIDLIAYLRVLR